MHIELYNPPNGDSSLKSLGKIVMACRKLQRATRPTFNESSVSATITQKGRVQLSVATHVRKLMNEDHRPPRVPDLEGA